MQAELTVAMDWYTRCITGIRVTPVSTKAGDVSAVLFQCFRPRPAGRDWPHGALWPEHGIPHTVLVDVDVDGAIGEGLASPPLMPETLVVDHGKVYVSEHLTSVCRRMGISIQPARLRTGTRGAPADPGRPALPEVAQDQRLQLPDRALHGLRLPGPTLKASAPNGSTRPCPAATSP
ncbi:hypothetical protein ACGFY9_28010 [Streptomyces sp. NPDC048504]|uniref:hypothetical protein n=1 Tax=Streptomyces sp. NPDC048504 TaxID=3365559 RepID=UPI0037222EBB